MGMAIKMCNPEVNQLVINVIGFIVFNYIRTTIHGVEMVYPCHLSNVLMNLNFKQLVEK